MNKEINMLKPVVLKADEPLPDGYPAWLEDLDTGVKYLIPYGSWTLGRRSDGPNTDIPISTTPDNMAYISKMQGIVTLKRNLIGENALFYKEAKGAANPSNVEGFEMNQYFDYQILNEDLVQVGATFFRAHLSQPGDD